MKKITNRYTISFESIESRMSTEIQISKKEFERQLKFLRIEMAATEGYEYPMEEHFYEHSSEIMTERTYRFDVCTGSTYLSHYECKPGYQFK